MLNAPSQVNSSPRTVVLADSWQQAFEEVLGFAKHRITLCAPYITGYGADVVRSVRGMASGDGLSVLILTDFSPLAISTGSTEPAAVALLREQFPTCRCVHLPRLHAKVYVADRARAIVTSGNLTYGGLMGNHECGLLVDDTLAAARVDDEVAEYAGLGAEVDTARLDELCGLAVDARAAYKAQAASASRESTRRLRAVLRSASDTLVRARLAEGPVHSVFARTIEFLLRRHGALTTEQMHPMIQHMHPDLCDDSLDRVIDGKRFGKKWKHAVRTAQQKLKRDGLVHLAEDQWQLVDR